MVAGATDRVFRALADPARRSILDRLRQRPCTTGELAEGFEVSRFMVMKHLKALVDAGLVLVERAGRVRWNHLNPAPIQAAYRRWIEPFDAVAADAALRIKQLAEARADAHPPSPQRQGTEVMEHATFAVQEVLVEVRIDAPRERVWNTLVDDTAAWWPKDYYVRAEGAAFKLDARVGGHLWEDYGGGEGTVWATVTQVRRPEALRLAAEVWPEFGGPARTIQRFELTEDGGATVLRFRDTLYGQVSDETVRSMDAGWRYLFGTAFKEYVEAGRIPPETSPLAC